MCGHEKVNRTVNVIELSPHADEHWDPYAVVHKVSEAPHRVRRGMDGCAKSRSRFRSRYD